MKYFVFVLGVLLVLGFALKGTFTHEKFDSKTWKSWVESEEAPSLRWDMMNSLRKSHQLKGKTKQQVLQLLGEPNSQSKNQLSYYLGYSKSGVNTATLFIDFNDENVVVRFFVNQG